MPTDGANRMRTWALDFPAQIRDSLEQARTMGWPALGAFSPRAVFLGGMGGSAMACSMARSLTAGEGNVPCAVHQDPEVPAWVGPDTLAVIASYSGETWEALEMRDTCLARGAAVLVLARGGPLFADARLPEERRFRLPAGFAPRAALGWMVPPVLLAMTGTSSSVLEELHGALPLLEEESAMWRDGRSVPGRDPREIAGRLAGRFVSVYSPNERLRPLGVRWKNQLLENAKTPAAESAFPELAHNDIMGWRRAVQAMDPVLLYPEEPASGLRRGMTEAALRYWAELGGRIERVPARGETFTARLLSHVALADLVTIELAERMGIDPLPVGELERVKREGRKEDPA